MNIYEGKGKVIYSIGGTKQSWIHFNITAKKIFIGIPSKCYLGPTHAQKSTRAAFSRDLTIPHLDLSHFALCIMGN